MLRFAFKPRHPVTQVAFTADGREIVTAQPHTGIAVRNRLTGEARVTVPIPRAIHIAPLAVRMDSDWIGIRTCAGIHMIGPRWFNNTTAFDRPRSIAFGTTLGSHSAVTWFHSHHGLLVWTMELASPDVPEVFHKSPEPVRIQNDARLHTVSPDTAFALLFRSRQNPFLASVETGGLMAELKSPLRHRYRPVDQVATFSSDGTKLALREGESVSVFDLTDVPRTRQEEIARRTLEPRLTLERPDPSRHGTFADKNAEHWLPPVAFDHTGRTMFTLGLRNRVQRIDLATGGVMGEWGWRCEPIRSLAVAPDDLNAVAGCQRGEVVVWDLE